MSRPLMAPVLPRVLPAVLPAILLGGLLLTALDPVHAGPITRIIAFGDSNLDTGNAFALDPDTVPAPHVNGRFSNGPLSIEYVAADLGVPLKSYAVGGAWSGTLNNFELFQPTSPLAGTGVLNQLAQWQTDATVFPAHPGDLFVYWAGSNDLFVAGNGHATDALTLDERVAGVQANLNTALALLDGHGAQRILVATRTPRATLFEVDSNENDRRGVVLNAAIRETVAAADANLGASIELFDAYAVIADIMRNRVDLGFLDTAALCFDDSNCYTDPTVAARYVNWDGAHKTTAVLRLTADALAQQLDNRVPLPGSLPLLLLGLAGLLARRRRSLSIS